MEEGPKRDRHLSGVCLVIASTPIYSLSGVLTKTIAADAWTIMCWRGLVGGLLIAAYLAWSGRNKPSGDSFRLGWQGWLLASVGSLASLAFILAFKMTYVANVAVIYATTPFIAGGLGWLFVRERFRLRTVIAAVVSLIGVAIVVSGGLGSVNIVGDMVALAMAFGTALYMTLIRVFRRSPVVWAGGVSAIQLFAVSWLIVDPLTITQHDAFLVLLFGISFAIALVLWTEGTKLIPAAEAGLLGTAEMPFAVLLAGLLLGEVPPIASFVGGSFVLAAVFTHATLDARD